MQEFPQKPVNQQYLWVQNVFHISTFSSCEKSSVSTCFHSSRKPGPWSSETSYGAPDANHDVVTQHPGTAPPPGQCPTQLTGHGVTFCQGMEWECHCQQEWQKRWRSTLQCLWHEDQTDQQLGNTISCSPRQLAISTMIPLWASCIGQTGKRNKYRRAGAKIHC